MSTSRDPEARYGATIESALDQLWPRYVELLSSLVQTPSLGGAEEPAQRLLASHAEKIGLETDLWTVDIEALTHHPDFATADHTALARPNVTAIMKGTGGGRSLTLSGHVDVVSTEPEHLWTDNPYSGAVVGDRLYGRGSMDMKGGLVAALLAIDAIRTAGVAPRGDIVFESVIEEESTGNGTLAARVRGPNTDAAIIPEITHEDVHIANPGVVWFEVTVRGRAAYVGLAGASVNAIEVATDLATFLRTLPAELNASFSHPAFDGYDSPLTLNVGTIRGGDWPSNVPLECVIGVRMAYPIGWSVDQAKQFVVDRIAAFGASHAWLAENPPQIRWHGFQARGYAIDPESPIVALLRSQVEAVSGEPARVTPMFGTADARYFGDVGVPATYYGPTGGGMHSPDEWVSLASVRRVAAVLARTAVEWTS
ncbi:ArgE/DapE family deacylase [Microbacterium sp. MC2]